MRVHISKATAIAVAGLVGIGSLGGCGTKKKAIPATTVAGTTAATTTTEAATTTTTTVVDTGTATSTDTGTSTTTGTDTGGTPATSKQNTWTANATDFHGRNGLRVTYTCPPNGTPSNVWGTGPFTDDSSVCTAAVFSGLITLNRGGKVVIQIAPGEQQYAAGTAHGITTSSYASWGGSYTFPKK